MACTILVAATAVIGDPLAVFAKEQLVLGLRHRMSRMQSIRVRFDWKRFDGAGNALPQAPGGGQLIVAGSVFVVHCAPYTYIEKELPTIAAREIASSDGTTSRRLDLTAMNVSILPQGDERVASACTILRLMGYPMSARAKVLAMHPEQLDAAAMSNTSFLQILPASIERKSMVVASKQELIDKTWCHVVGPENPRGGLWIRFWIDPTRDFAVLRADEMTGADYVSERIDLLDRKPVGETFFPHLVINSLYDTLRRRVELITRYTVSEVSIGDVKPEDAQLKPPGGALVLDAVQKKAYTAPGPPDARLEAMAVEARRRVGLPDDLRDYVAPPTTWERSKRLLIWANVAIVALIAAIIARKRYSARTRNVHP